MTNPGSIVRFRQRLWALLPSASPDHVTLRPLTGSDDETLTLYRRLIDLIGYTLPSERITPAAFPPPDADHVADAASAHLLWQAARLSLREGATPFRSLGRISIRPRTYQFVPLLMALRLDPVRLFIADDVGVGKTIEALLVARELLDRGEIGRFCVLCPPALCEQWSKELAEKFNLDAVIVRSGTVSQLERQVPPGATIYESFPVQVISIDFVKTERNRHQFLQFCPDLVIVDEAHGAAAAQGRGQQERHALVQDVARKPRRHLILLTATPHSGIEEAFRSLLGLVRPEFADWRLDALSDAQRSELARHFVQRTRRDIEQGWEAIACFPRREPQDETYELSDGYRRLFERTYQFCFEIVQTGEHLDARRRRVRSWGALSLLRCVMSSPAAAVATLASRGALVFDSDDEADFRPFVFEVIEERATDESPTPPLDATVETLPDADRRRLRELARMARDLSGPEHDAKLRRAVELTRHLIDEGFHPILWCRYVATAEYVADQVQRDLPDGVQVACVTGRMGDEERQARIAELDADRPRVLVATDCLSEGVNLQSLFTAVVHYDLPWNPNRLEQREGRVDRYGQPAPRVRVIRFFGRDNPVDGAVLDVLLNKARTIHRTLGTYVPVPEESESVTQAVLEALFLRGRRTPGAQLTLDLGIPAVEELHRRWDRDVDRERVNRTRFAQRALKPEEVQRELEATDAVLGDPSAVRDFVLETAQRLNLPITPDPKRADVFRVSLAPDALRALPDAIRMELPDSSSSAARRANPFWSISFVSPTPEGAEYVGRNHRLVTALAQFLFEEALERSETAIARRCGAIRTHAVQETTTILLLRVRYMLEYPNAQPVLSEEVLALGYRDHGSKMHWLDHGEALSLLASARPAANMPLEEKQTILRQALARIGEWHPVQGGAWGDDHPIQSGIRQWIDRRAADLTEAHKRIRQAVALRVRGLEMTPQFPPDLLGVVVLERADTRR